MRCNPASLVEAAMSSLSSSARCSTSLLLGLCVHMHMNGSKLPMLGLVRRTRGAFTLMTSLNWTTDWSCMCFWKYFYTPLHVYFSLWWYEVAYKTGYCFCRCFWSANFHCSYHFRGVVCFGTWCVEKAVETTLIALLELRHLLVVVCMLSFISSGCMVSGPVFLINWVDSPLLINIYRDIMLKFWVILFALEAIYIERW